MVEGHFTPSSGRSQGHPVSAMSSRAIPPAPGQYLQGGAGRWAVPRLLWGKPEVVDGTGITDDPTDKDPDFQDGREKCEENE